MLCSAFSDRYFTKYHLKLLISLQRNLLRSNIKIVKLPYKNRSNYSLINHDLIMGWLKKCDIGLEIKHFRLKSVYIHKFKKFVFDWWIFSNLISSLVTIVQSTRNSLIANIAASKNNAVDKLVHLPIF